MRGFCISRDLNKMETRTFKVNSKLLSTGFPREFDAHIYFSIEELEKAQKLRDQMKSHFAGVTFFVGDMIDVPIGPHPTPMFEANFPQDIFTEVVLWLMKERGALAFLSTHCLEMIITITRKGSCGLALP